MFLVRNFVSDIPEALDDSARIDGAGDITIADLEVTIATLYKMKLSNKEELKTVNQILLVRYQNALKTKEEVKP